MGAHITAAGKLEVIFEHMVIFEGYGHLSSNHVLVKRFGRNEPSKKQKTFSGSGGAATQLAEVPRCPPAVAEWPHHTGTTEMATPPPEIMQSVRQLREDNPHRAVQAVRCPLVPGGWAVTFGGIVEDSSESSGLDNDDDDDDDP